MAWLECPLARVFWVILVFANLEIPIMKVGLPREAGHGSTLEQEQEIVKVGWFCPAIC
jgi:hypothetical protein